MSELDEIFEPITERNEKVDSEPIKETEETTSEETKVAESETTSQVESETDAETKPEPEKEVKAEDKAEGEEKKDDSEQEWTFTAVKDERRKRQESERKREESDRRLAEAERKLEELQRQQLQPKKELPDVLEDQNAFADSLREEYDQKLYDTRVQMGREMMIDAHDDYIETEKVFLDVVAKENPVLAAEARKSSNPAKFLYQNTKKYQEYKDLQDVDLTRERIRAEVRKELEAELKANQEAESAKVSDIKPSLAKARASDKESFEPESLESIFGNK